MALYNRYKNEHTSENGIKWQIEILDSTLSSGNMNTEFSLTPDGLTIKWDGENDERYQPVKASACRFTIMIENATLAGFPTLLAAADEGRFTVKVQKYDGSSWDTYWRGFIVAQDMEIEDIDYPYEFDVEAIDGIGRLKDLNFNHTAGIFAVGTKYRGTKYVREMLRLCGYIADFGTGNTFLTTIIDIYEDSMSNIGAQNSDPLYKTQCNANVFLNIDDNAVQNPVSAMEVLENWCQIFGARIFQAGGTWHFIQIQRYHTAGNVEYRRYDEDADTAALGNGTTDLNKIGGTANTIDIDSTTIIKLAGMKKSFYNPLYRAAIQYGVYGSTSLIQTTPTNQYAGSTPSVHNLGTVTANANDKIIVSWAVNTDYNGNGTYVLSTISGGYTGLGIGGNYLILKIYNSTGEYWDNTNNAWVASDVPNYIIAHQLTGFFMNPNNDYAAPSPQVIVMEATNLPRSDTYYVSFASDLWIMASGYDNPPDISALGTGQISAHSSGTIATMATYPLTVFNAPNEAADSWVHYMIGSSVVANRDYFCETANNASELYKTEVIIGDGPKSTSVGHLEVWNGAAWVVSDLWQQSGAGTSATLLTVMAETMLSGQKNYVDKNEQTLYLKGGEPYLFDFTNSIKITEGGSDYLYIPNGMTIKTGFDEISGVWFKSVIDATSLTNTVTDADEVIVREPDRIGYLR